jgi:hypothetical protein
MCGLENFSLKNRPQNCVPASQECVTKNASQKMRHKNCVTKTASQKCISPSPGFFEGRGGLFGQRFFGEFRGKTISAHASTFSGKLHGPLLPKVWVDLMNLRLDVKVSEQ